MKGSKIIVLLALLVTILAGCGGQQAKDGTKQEPAGTKAASQPLDEKTALYYVDVPWLVKNLNNVVVVDARAKKEYAAGHIPGAVNIPWQSLSDMSPKQGEKGWGVVLAPEKLAEKLGSLGIDGSKEIIVYNDPKGLGEEGRVLWMLRYAGLKNSRMLNGGFPAWTTAGNEETEENTKVTPVKFTITSPDTSRLVTTEYVKANLKNIKLVDARSPEEYNGESDHGEKTRGHIPGANHLHFRDAYNADGTIKSIPDLQAMFAAKGLKPEDNIVTYCTVGIRSGFLAEIMRMAGFEKAANYNGSFSEWAGADLPSEK